MDWHTSGNPAKLPWNQPSIRLGMAESGNWSIDVRQSREYTIELRRWPVESEIKLNEAISKQLGEKIAKARLKSVVKN